MQEPYRKGGSESILALSLAGEPAPGTFTTIDFPGAADTVECCSAILNINPEGQIVGGYLDTSGILSEKSGATARVAQ
jgi:hypothetical protein